MTEPRRAPLVLHDRILSVIQCYSLQRLVWHHCADAGIDWHVLSSSLDVSDLPAGAKLSVVATSLVSLDLTRWSLGPFALVRGFSAGVLHVAFVDVEHFPRNVGKHAIATTPSMHYDMVLSV